MAGLDAERVLLGGGWTNAPLCHTTTHGERSEHQLQSPWTHAQPACAQAGGGCLAFQTVLSSAAPPLLPAASAAWRPTTA